MSATRRRAPLTMIAVALVFTLFFAVPLVALIWRAVETERITDFLADDMVRDALQLSMMTSLTTLVVAVLLGTPVAFLLARWPFRGRGLIETVLDLPLILPPVVAGVALLMAFGRRGLLGSELDMLGIRLPFTTLGVIVAQLFVASPFYLRSARAGFASIDRDIEAAAELDGASTWRLLLDVSIPAALPAIAAGAVLCWARALSEFGATLLFAGNLQGRTQTMPLAIMTAFESSLGAALALSVILLVISFLILFVSRLVTQGARGIV